MLNLIMMSGLAVWLKIISSVKNLKTKMNIYKVYTALLDGLFFEHLKQDNKSKLFRRITAKLESVKCKCWVAGTEAECVVYIKWHR